MAVEGWEFRGGRRGGVVGRWTHRGLLGEGFGGLLEIAADGVAEAVAGTEGVGVGGAGGVGGGSVGFAEGGGGRGRADNGDVVG